MGRMTHNFFYWLSLDPCQITKRTQGRPPGVPGADG
jgi:hypothetical protein